MGVPNCPYEQGVILKKHQFLFTALSVVAAIIGFATQAQAELIYGITQPNSTEVPAVNLVSFQSSTPGTITTIGPLSGVVAGQGVRSIDFRPANGQLYAISSNAAAAQIYTVNLTTAALTPVGPGFTLGTSTFTSVEIEFNPSVDRIRVVTAASGTSGLTNNFRVNPNTGLLLATDTNLAYASTDPQTGDLSFNIIGTAYSNNISGTSVTTLYGWDFNEDDLVTIGNVNGTPNSPNTGLMFTVFNPAPAFRTFNAALGMDISGVTGTLYVTHDDPATGTSMNFYTLDKTTGAETLVGAYPAGTFISDISVITPPTAAGVVVSGRVLSSAEGRGLRNALVTMTDQSGQGRTALTGSNGNYTYADVEAGGTYVVSVRSRRFSFSPRVLQITDNIADLDFVPEQ